MVPFSHVSDVGLRKVTKNGEVAKVLEFLARGKAKSCQDWKDRFKENSEKMRNGSLIETAEVLKCLLIRQLDRPPLSFREKKMLDRARHLLVTECSIARGLADCDTTDLLDPACLKR